MAFKTNPFFHWSRPPKGGRAHHPDLPLEFQRACSKKHRTARGAPRWSVIGVSKGIQQKASHWKGRTTLIRNWSFRGYAAKSIPLDYSNSLYYKKSKRTETPENTYKLRFPMINREVSLQPLWALRLIKFDGGKSYLRINYIRLTAR